MRQHTTWLTLLDLATKASEVAAKHLMQVQQAYTKILQQRQQLESYQDEYTNKLNLHSINGIAINEWQDHQQFLSTLEHAIHQQKNQLTLWEQHVKEAKHDWQKKQQRANAFKILIQRAEQNKKQNLIQSEQKQMDEFALRAILRRSH